jgi:leucyl/phenylalanyl-tRNA--protein transferase
MPVFLLSDNEVVFPPPNLARADGLLALGGDLRPARLLAAYRRGIFPWYLEGEPILWWSPDPRLVLYPGALHVPRRLGRLIRQGRYSVTTDVDFPAVIRACATTHLSREKGTWILPEMIDAYIALYEIGCAHSVEVWEDGRLAGGLYGVSLGAAFFGESMFSRVRDASKVGLVRLVEMLERKGFTLIDCQVTTKHLMRFGARELPRERFLSELRQALCAPTLPGRWTLDAPTAESQPSSEKRATHGG